jgi:hypothetical protein
MATKKAVGKAKKAKTPTAAQLRKEISADVGRENTLKHDAATARSASTRKHDLAQAASIGKTVTSLKHELATKTKKKTGLALNPGDVACCAAQAVAASLWLALGVRVHEEDVLGLYWRTAGDPDEGASILATLRAAREYGLPGPRGAAYPVLTGRSPLDLLSAAPSPAGCFRSAADSWPTADTAPALAAEAGVITRGLMHRASGPIILNLRLPKGQHAVTVAPDGTWWSWGEPYRPADFPGAVVDAAWAVTW